MKKIIILSLLVLITSNLGAAERMNILVQPFRNDGPKDFSWISSGMTETVIADLGRIQGIKVISDAERKKAMEEIALAGTGLMEASSATEVGSFLGAHVIFSGTYTVIGDNIRVIAKLTKVKTGETEKSIKVDGQLKDIFSVQDRIVMDLLRETEKIDIAGVQKLKVSDTEIKKIENKPAMDYTAYQYYSMGLEVMNSDPRKGLEYFLKAIEIQDDYADAYKLAGYVQSGLLYKHDEGYTLLLKAESLYNARQDNYTSNYADLLTLIGGNYYNRLKYPESITYYQRSQKIYENLGMRVSHGYANNLYGIAASQSGLKNYDDAIANYNRSDKIFQQLKMTGSVSYGHLMYGIAYIYGQKAQYDPALEYYQKTRAIYERNGMHKTVIMGNLIYNIAWCHDWKKNYALAVKYYLEAYDAYVAIGYEGKEKQAVFDRAQYLKPWADQQQ